MVLYLCCVLFFRPAGRKNNTQRIENHRQAKVLYGMKKPPSRKKAAEVSLLWFGQLSAPTICSLAGAGLVASRASSGSIGSNIF